ncbi:type IIL restriction-modification enzyme MmeI, partial [Actinokineospora sp. 24-640]
VTHSKNAREKWWLYERSRPQLYAAIAGLDRVLVVARVSKTALPVFVRTGQVISEAAVIFATDNVADLALLSSGFHYSWAIARGSSLKGDLRYTPSDIYETLPRPTITTWAKNAGAVLDEARRDIMSERQIGLTKLYNMVHDISVTDPDIATLRDVHVNIDEAISDAYKFGVFPLHHGFHQTERGVRFTVAPSVRTEVLDRLLALNHAQHASVRVPEKSIEEATTESRKDAMNRLSPGHKGMLF